MLQADPIIMYFKPRPRVNTMAKPQSDKVLNKYERQLATNSDNIRQQEL